MIPTAAEVVRRRWTVRTVLRLAGLVLMASAAWPLASWLDERLWTRDWFDVAAYEELLLTGGVPLVVGAVAFELSGWVARLVVGLDPTTRCPLCAYVLDDDSATCPECGLDVSSMGAMRDAAPWGEATRKRTEWIVAIVARGCGLVLAYPAGVDLAYFWWDQFAFGGSMMAYERMYFAERLLGLCVGVLLVAAPRWVARLVVPPMPESAGGPRAPGRSKPPARSSETAVGGADDRGEHSDDDPDKARSTG